MIQSGENQTNGDRRIPSPLMTQFLILSLDHKRRSCKRFCLASDSAYNSDFQFSLCHYCSCDSDSDSVASENWQPLGVKLKFVNKLHQPFHKWVTLGSIFRIALRKEV